MSEAPGRAKPHSRSDYRRFFDMETRWNDMDRYGHVNNVVYLEYFDSALNRALIGRWSVFPLFTFPLVYNYVFLVGLMNYLFGIGQGAQRLEQGDADDGSLVSGRTLLAMAERRFDDERVAAEAKGVLRRVIRYHLGGKPLNTRRILQDLKQL